MSTTFLKVNNNKTELLVVALEGGWSPQSGWMLRLILDPTRSFSSHIKSISKYPDSSLCSQILQLKPSFMPSSAPTRTAAMRFCLLYFTASWTSSSMVWVLTQTQSWQHIKPTITHFHWFPVKFHISYKILTSSHPGSHKPLQTGNTLKCSNMLYKYLNTTMPCSSNNICWMMNFKPEWWLEWSIWGLLRSDSPERSGGSLSDSHTAVQQHGPQAPHSIPLEKTWDGLTLLHHPRNTGTCKLSHVSAGTLQLQEACLRVSDTSYKNLNSCVLIHCLPTFLYSIFVSRKV